MLHRTTIDSFYGTWAEGGFDAALDLCTDDKHGLIHERRDYFDYTTLQRQPG